MTAITFDTHKFIRKLKDAGFEEKQAEAVADAFRDAQTGTETVTKHDLKELELSLKAEMQTLRSDMQAMEYRMTIKLGGMMAASVAVVAALIKLL
jgi:DNA-binding transcriptional MerR regulator